jgi:hypothetical protein
MEEDLTIRKNHEQGKPTVQNDPISISSPQMSLLFFETLVTNLFPELVPCLKTQMEISGIFHNFVESTYGSCSIVSRYSSVNIQRSEK